MKIAHLITSLSHGGAQEALFNIVTNSAEEFDHVVISMKDLSKYGALLKKKKIKCYHLNISKFKLNFLQKFFELKTIIKNEKPDLIQSWMYHADFLGSLISYLTKIPIYWGLVNYSLDKKTTKLNTRIVAKICAYLSFYIPSVIISCSKNASNEHIKIGYTKNKFKNIDLGIVIENNSNFFNNSVEKKFNPNDKLILGCIGRWDPQKNHVNLLKALNKLIYIDNINIKCILAGPNINSSNKELTKLINNYKLNNFVELIGYVENLDHFFDKIHIKILPSIGEAFPIVLLETMIKKKIVLATDVGENYNIIRDKELIIKSSNHEDIYNSINKVYKLFENREWVANKIHKLHSIVVNNYDIKKSIKLYENEWKKIY